MLKVIAGVIVGTLSYFEAVTLAELMYLVFTRVPGNRR